MLELMNIRKQFDNVNVLDDVHLKVDNLDWVILSGESGSGKTTLLKIMTGLIQADLGEIVYYNKKLNNEELERLRQSEFSIVFQEKNLIPEYTVYQNLLYTSSYNHVSVNKIDELLNRFHLDHLRNRKVSQLSAGQIQKIALVRSLLKEAKILFLDEPTGNLDETSTQEIIEMLEEINKTVTIVMITHNESLFQYANKVFELKEGKIINKKNTEKSVIENKKEVSIPRNKLSHKIMLKMSVWNFLYYKKTYLLAVLIFVLSCVGFSFSTFIGKNINDDLRNLMLERDAEYEITVNSDEVLSKEEIKQISDNTKAKDYDLKLHLFSPDKIQKIIINGNQNVSITGIEFKSTYEISNPQYDIYISSSLYNEMKKEVSNIKKIEIDTGILGGFKNYSTIYWVEKDFRLYIPQYQNETIVITDFQIIDSQKNIIYLNNSLIENLADKYNSKDQRQSNQQIKNFRLKYSNYQDLLNALQYLEKQNRFHVFSVYDDFHQIQQNVKEQFLIFSYSSYILTFIMALVLCFIIIVLEQNKNEQYKILYEQGITKKEQLIISIYEICIFLIIALLISILSIILITTLFNYKYDVITFLPYSLIELAATYELPIENIKLFHIHILSVLKSLLLISAPALIIAITASHYRKMKSIY